MTGKHEIPGNILGNHIELVPDYLTEMPNDDRKKGMWLWCKVCKPPSRGYVPFHSSKDPRRQLELQEQATEGMIAYLEAHPPRHHV